MIRYYLDKAAGDFELRLERKTEGSSGFDLQANIGTAREFSPRYRFSVRTGVYIAMPLGIEAHVRPRSGLARDHGVMTVFGSIDSDYRGEIGVTLLNHGHEPYRIVPGERVAQLVFVPVIIPGARPCCPLLEDHPQIVRVDSIEALGNTTRGTSGFGSTGR